MRTNPRSPAAMILHEPIPVAIKTTAPMTQASVDVSPIDPGIKPRNACIQLTLPPASASGPVTAASASHGRATAAVDSCVGGDPDLVT